MPEIGAGVTEPQPTTATVRQTVIESQSAAVEDDRPQTGDVRVFDGFMWRNQNTRGDAFPASPVNGQLFVRTDETPPKLYVYDESNTQWGGA